MCEELGHCYHHLANCRLFLKIVHCYYLQMYCYYNVSASKHQSKKEVIGVMSLCVDKLWNGKCNQHMSSIPDTLITLMILQDGHVLITISFHYTVWCVTVTVLQNNGSVIVVEYRGFGFIFSLQLACHDNRSIRYAYCHAIKIIVKSFFCS